MPGRWRRGPPGSGVSAGDSKRVAGSLPPTSEGPASDAVHRRGPATKLRTPTGETRLETRAVALFRPEATSGRLEETSGRSSAYSGRPLVGETQAGGGLRRSCQPRISGMRACEGRPPTFG